MFEDALAGAPVSESDPSEDAPEEEEEFGFLFPPGVVPMTPRPSPRHQRLVDVNLRDMAGTTGRIQAESEDTLAKLKSRISAEWNIPEAQQRLILGESTTLDDLSHAALQRRLRELAPEIEDESVMAITITVVRRQPDEATVLYTLLHNQRVVTAQTFEPFVPMHLRASRDVMRCAARVCHPMCLSYAAPEVKADSDFFHKLLLDGVKGAFHFASQSLRADRSFILATVAQDPSVVSALGEPWLRDKEVVLAIVRQHGQYLRHVQPELRNDRDVVAAAVAKDPSALTWAPAEMRGERDFIASAVAHNAHALEFASPDLRRDGSFILLLLQRSPSSAKIIFLCAGENLRHDRDFVLQAALVAPNILKCLTGSWVINRPFLLEAAGTVPGAYKYLKRPLSYFRRERRFVLDLVVRDPTYLEHARSSFRFSRSFVLEAVRRNPATLQYAAQAFRLDPELQAAAAPSPPPPVQEPRKRARQQ